MLKLLTGMCRLSCPATNSPITGPSSSITPTTIPQQTATVRSNPALTGVTTTPPPSETLTTIKDGIQFSDAGILTRGEKEVVARVVNASKGTGLPDADDMAELGRIVNRIRGVLRGAPVPESAEVRNATKRFIVDGHGFGDKNLRTLTADKQDLEGQVSSARMQIEQLQKIKSHTTNEKDQMKLGVQIAELEQSINTNEAKITHIDTKIQLIAARDRNTPLESLRELAESPYAEVRLAVVQHPNASYMAGPRAPFAEGQKETRALKLLDLLCQDNDPRISEIAIFRAREIESQYEGNIGKGPSTTSLDMLAKHTNPSVRELVAAHGNTHIFIVEELALDADPAVASAARKNLAAILPIEQRRLFPNGDHRDYMVHYRDAMTSLKALSNEIPTVKTLEALNDCQRRIDEHLSVVDRSIACMHANSASTAHGENSLVA